MARQNYATNPSEKKLEVFQDFSGGLNTVTTQDNMMDNELNDATNLYIAERGALRPIPGMEAHLVPTSGLGQGYFRWYENANTFIEIVASGGNFYINGKKQKIEGTNGFQDTRPIEGVQFKDTMYFATGSKLVQFDGKTFKVVQPKKPDPMEALYVGLNALDDYPDDFITDGVDAFPSLTGVTFSTRYGLVNKPVVITAYVLKPETMTVEYKIQIRKTTDAEGYWKTVQDWSTKKTYTHYPKEQGDIQVLVSLRDKANPTEDYTDPVTGKVTKNEIIESTYMVPKYLVKPAPDPADVQVDTSRIHECNRIILHWNRLMLFGDLQNPDTMFISQLNEPDYFPINNCLKFENPRNEQITAAVRYRDILIVFTETSIQALTGKSPYDYTRVMLNTSTGCIAPKSAVVVKNYVMFLSKDGVYVLKSVGYVEDKANVEKVDSKIANLVPIDEFASACFHDGQYHITFPTYKKRLRLDYELSAWMKDEHSTLDFGEMWDIQGVLYAQSRYNGRVVKFNPDIKTFLGQNIDITLETKFFSFGQPYHIKKLKQVHFLIAPISSSVKTEVYIYADEEATVRPDKEYATIDNKGNVKWVVESEPNMIISGGTVFGDWELGVSKFGNVEFDHQKLRVSGKCLKTKIKMLHNEAKDFKIVGFAYVFKLKKPK